MINRETENRNFITMAQRYLVDPDETTGVIAAAAALVSIAKSLEQMANPLVEIDTSENVRQRVATLKIATICASTTQKGDIEALNRELTLDGYIVLAPGVFHHSEAKLITPEVKKKLDELHRMKIDLSDIVYFIAKNDAGEFGYSTGTEHTYAREKGKRIVIYPPGGGHVSKN